MQFIPPLSAILLLIGTTFSLQAIPMFGEGELHRASESSSAGGASMQEDLGQSHNKLMDK